MGTIQHSPAHAMRRSPRGTRTKKYTKQAAQERFIELVAEGLTHEQALEKVQRTRQAMELWRRDSKNDGPQGFYARHEHAKQVKRIKASGAKRGNRDISFTEFRRRYLKSETFWHQLQWVDMLEGHEPRDLHSAQVYAQGKRNRVLINTPPFHSKTVLMMDFITYKLCLNPDYRVLLISETTDLAKDILYGVQQRLTNPTYIELQMAYAPQGGYRPNSDEWSQDVILFGPSLRSGTEKDPNLQALGLGSQIYGRRADLIVGDDLISTNNSHRWEKQMKWLRREVDSRVEMGGRICIVGSRTTSVDLYSELLNPEHYANGKPPWTYLASPAILEYGQTPEEHRTLWPYSEVPWVRDGADADDECECGTQACKDGFLDEQGRRLYPRWDGLHLEIGPRANNNASEWALTFQQTSIHDNAVFPQHAIQKSTKPGRLPGVLQADTPGHPIGGMHGMYVVGGVDPAVKGYAGLTVAAVDRATGRIYLLNAWNIRAPTPDQLKQRMKDISVQYSVHEWRVERTGLLQFFTQDAELRQWMQLRGIKFVEHQTSGNKWDPSFGVASMASLFGEWKRATGPHGEPLTDWEPITEPLIELPRMTSEGLKALAHQLVIWTPELDPNRVPCDMVMSLWFLVVGARAATRTSSSGSLNPYKGAHRFLSPASRRSRVVVSMTEASGT